MNMGIFSLLLEVIGSAGARYWESQPANTSALNSSQYAIVMSTAGVCVVLIRTSAW